MAKWSAGPTAVLTARVRFQLETLTAGFQCKVIELHAFYDVITEQTEFVVSIVNSVKIVNMP